MACTFLDDIVEEVALEGLDGITLPDLLKRLRIRSSNNLWNQGSSEEFSSSDGPILDFLWNSLRRDPCISIFRLSAPRGEIVFKKLSDLYDAKSGSEIVQQETEDTYPFALVDEQDGTYCGIKGSCKDFQSRKDITSEVKTKDNAESLFNDHGGPRQIVFVADQWRRGKTLLGESFCPFLMQTISALQWCLLERIGRSREIGEGTIGKNSLQFANENPKSIFYQTKFLLKSGVIKKQTISQVVRGQRVTGKVFHLKRFYSERKSEASCVIDKIVNFLKDKPDKLDSWLTVKQSLNISWELKKLLKFPDCQRIIFTDMKKLEEDAKAIRVIGIRNVHGDNEDNDESLIDEEDEGSGFLNTSKVDHDLPLLYQAYHLICAKGSAGMSQVEIGDSLGLDKLAARSICRSLVKNERVKVVSKDVGRQRITLLVAKAFENSGTVMNIEIEKKKMNALSETVIKTERDQKSSTSKKVGNKKDEKSAQNESVSGSLETERRLKRANAIISYVKKNLLVDDINVLFRLIINQEAEEGCQGRMDKKSLRRLLEFLAEEGRIKNFIMKISNDSGEEKTLHFVCDPTVKERDEIVINALEEAKHKMSFVSVPTSRASLIDSSVSESIQDLAKVADGDKDDSELLIEYNKKITSKYGSLPKYERMHELHGFMFYLNLKSKETSFSKEEAFEWLQSQCDAMNVSPVTEDELQNFSLYKKEIGWKMFVPPLPEHKNWPHGWILLCDILLRLPLSLFVKLINVTVVIPGIEAYLDHPIKRHFLVRTLPKSIRLRLFFKRKYVSSVFEILVNLAHIGLVQFSNCSFKAKDQSFIYLNSKGLLFDTRSLKEDEYPPDESLKITFSFNDLHDVENYWFKMWRICMESQWDRSDESRLKERKLKSRALLEKTLEPKEKEEAYSNDTGYIPGDMRGCCGHDSSLYSHLRRNWQSKPLGLHAESLSVQESESSDARFNLGKHGVASVTKESGVTARSRKRKKIKNDPQSDEPKLSKRKVDNTSQKRPKTPKEPTTPKKPYYDEKDKEALKLMRKLRVDWTSQEDSFLLICKVAGAYLCLNTGANMVPYTWVRDILHEKFQESANKTSRACQRRINYMMKNSTTEQSVSLFLTEIKQDKEILAEFPIPNPNEMTKNERDEAMHEMYRPLVLKLLERYKNPKFGDEHHLPSSKEELFKHYSVIYPSNEESCKGFEDPTNSFQVQASVVNSLVMSTLCAVSEKTSWAYQLFKIYKQYPDSLLRHVMSQLRSDKMVSLKKNFNKTRMKRASFLPLSSSPYQLSVSFSHKLLTRYQYDIYAQGWEMFQSFVENLNEDSGVDIDVGKEGGYTAVIVAFAALEQLHFRIEVPEQLIVLDPKLQCVNKQYLSVLQRYKELLKSSGIADVETDFQEHLLQPTKAAVGKNKLKDISDETEKTSQKRKLPSGGPEPSKKPRFDADEEYNVVFSGGPESINPNGARSTNLVAKSASRIALYMMREEMNQDIGESMLAQHSHDYFVISSCSIKCKLDPDVANPVQELNKGKAKVLRDLGINSQGHSILSEERVTCKPKNIPSIEEIIEKNNFDESDISNVKAILYKVREGKDLGVKPDLIRSVCLSGSERRHEYYVEILLKSWIVVRSGIKTMRFLASEYISPWILKSFKVKRSAQKEMPRHGVSAKLLDTETDQEIHLSHKSKSSTPNPDKSSEIGEISNKIDWNGVDDVEILMRPWLKIDGTLNRRVIDRLLGAVLNEVMHKPGRRMSHVAQRFSPALQPVHCRELLEFLRDLSCITLMAVQDSPVTLFSTPDEIQMIPATILDSEETIVVEAEVDAINKLAHFIGNKNYTFDFACHCPCHAEFR